MINKHEYTHRLKTLNRFLSVFKDILLSQNRFESDIIADYQEYFDADNVILDTQNDNINRLQYQIAGRIFFIEGSISPINNNNNGNSKIIVRTYEKVQDTYRLLNNPKINVIHIKELDFIYTSDWNIINHEQNVRIFWQYFSRLTNHIESSYSNL